MYKWNRNFPYSLPPYLEDPFRKSNAEKLWMGNKLHNKQSEHSMRGFLCGHLHIRNTLLLGALVQNSWKGFTVSSKSFTSHSRPSSVCHLMTERGDSRVIVRPLWAASTPTGCVWSSCQRRHTDFFPPPGSRRYTSSAVGVEGCSYHRPTRRSLLQSVLPDTRWAPTDTNLNKYANL